MAAWEGARIPPPRHQAGEVVELYRKRPTDITYARGEHTPACCWCVYRNGLVCSSPINNPEAMCRQTENWCLTYNGAGQCDSYQPTRWTRLLQWLGLRMWIGRLSS